MFIIIYVQCINDVTIYTAIPYLGKVPVYLCACVCKTLAFKCRPLNSHGFTVRLKFLGLFSSSHDQVLISQGHAMDLKISQGFRL